METRTLETYKEQAAPALMREFSYGNPMEVPRLQKIVLNIGLGEARENPKALDSASADLATITGQKPVITRAKKSIANFRLREGMPRRHRNASRAADVRVLRPAGERRSAAAARLPRLLDKGVRRPGQLQPRRPGAVDIPRGRVRQDRPHPRHAD